MPAHPDQWRKTNDEFKKHPIEPRKKRPQDGARRSMPFDGSSRYRDEFVPKDAESPREKKKAVADPQLPFTGDTEHRRAFKGKPGDASDPIRPEDKVLESGPFEGDTEHRDKFRGLPTVLDRPTKQSEPWEYGPPRDLKSRNQSDYVPHKLLLCPARLLKVKKPARDGHCHFHPTGQHNTLGDPLYHP
eukprot:206003_1